MNVIIFGGHATGVELTVSLAELGNNVLAKDHPDFETSNLAIYLVEAQKSILPNMSKNTARKAKKYLRTLSITVLNKTSFRPAMMKRFGWTTVKRSRPIYLFGQRD